MNRSKQSARFTRFLRNEGLTTLVFCILLFSCTSQKSAVGSKVVLRVNQTEITAQEFTDRLARNLRGFDALHVKDEANLKRAKDQTLQSFIFEILVNDYAKTHQVSVSDEELEAEVSVIRSRYPDDNAFRRALADENTALEEWKKELRSTLLQKKIQKTLMTALPAPTEAEMRSFYEANRKSFERPARIQLRQIVVEKEDNAKRILDEINSGKDLATLAKKFSVAPEGENGGLTGWIEKGTLEVFDGAFRIPVGGRSKIVRSPYGWHIYEVVKKESEARLNFEQAKDRIRTLMRERKEQGVFSAWLEQQVRQSKVLRNDTLIQAIQVTTRGT